MIFLSRLPAYNPVDDNSPAHNPVDDGLLLRACLAQINARRLNAFVPHQVGEHGEIAVALEKTLSKTMTEGVRINYCRIETVFCAELFQMDGNTAACDAFSAGIYENETAGAADTFKPGQRFFLQRRGDIDAVQLPALGIEVKVTGFHMLYFDLCEFADTRAGGGKETNHEIPIHFMILEQTVFKIEIIRLADHIFQERLLLRFYRGQPQILPMQKFQVAVQAADAQVDGLWFVMVDQVHLEFVQVLPVDSGIMVVVLPDRGEIGRDRILRKAVLVKIVLETVDRIGRRFLC